MRTEEHIRAMHDRLDGINKSISIHSHFDDDAMAAYNTNAQMLCALKWVLGEDTITVTTGRKP